MRRRAVLAGMAATLAAAPTPAAFAQVLPGIFVRQGVIDDATAENGDAIANSGLIVGQECAAVIDPGGGAADGQALREMARAATRLRVRYVILTHVHPDHVFGTAAFADDRPQIVGHARLAGALAERGGFYRDRLAAILGPDGAGSIPAVDRVVDKTDTIDLGGRVLTLRAHPPAHTDNDLSIVDELTRALWAGDLLFVDRTPSLDGNLVGWLAELDRLAALPVAHAIPGHGPAVVAWPDAAAPIRRYLTKLRDETRALIRRGGDIADAPRLIAQSERAAWSLFDDYNPRNATVAFKELEWE